MTKKKIKQKLKKDLKTFNRDWREITRRKKPLKNTYKKMAEDIKNLNNDLLVTKDEKISKLLYHMLTTPIGAPFVSNKTLLDAALNFENQSFTRSDLRHLFSNLSKYEKYFNNELYEIFASFLQRLND